MKKIFNILIFTLLTALVLASCRQRDVPEPDLGGINLRINFKTPTPSAGGARTKADLENDIGSVYLFLIDHSTDEVYSIAQGTNILSGSAANSRTFEVVVIFGHDAPPERKYYCYVVANIDLTAGEMEGFKGDSYETLYGKLSADFDKTDVATDIAMWGMTPTDEAFTRESAPSTLDITLMRAVARVDVGLGKLVSGVWTGLGADDVLLQFLLKSIHIYRANDRYSFMPKLSERNLISTGLNTVVDYAPKVGSASQIGDRLLTSDTRHLHEIEGNNPPTTTLESSIKILTNIYIPEADVKQGGFSFDDNHVNRCAIIIGGFYAGSTVESYYRVDFNESNRGALIDVLRNHQYVLTITDVLGAGYLTRDDAYANRAVNMTVEILAWNETDLGEIEFDGTNHFSIGSKTLLTFNPLGTSRFVAAGSNVEPTEWEMRWGDNTGTFSKEPTLEGTHFTVEKPIVKQGGSFKFTTRATITGGDVTEVLYIRVNRLQMQITITQTALVENDWNPEGDQDIDI